MSAQDPAAAAAVSERAQAIPVGCRPDGALLIERTVESTGWFDALNWVLNIMPLFFAVGGYAARVGWASTPRKGGAADSFVRVWVRVWVRVRVRGWLWRRARPALPLFSFFTVVLGAARLLNLWPDLNALIDTFAVDIFVRNVVTDAWGVARIDVTTFVPGSGLFGLPNVLFVWLLAQQSGS